jgi:hypothetical protein
MFPNTRVFDACGDQSATGMVQPSIVQVNTKAMAMKRKAAGAVHGAQKGKRIKK